MICASKGIIEDLLEFSIRLSVPLHKFVHRLAAERALISARVPGAPGPIE